MPICRDIEALQPGLADAVRSAFNAFKANGLNVGIVETNRSQDVQDAYYAQGRESLETVNALRKKAGLYTLTPAENTRVVTQLHHSRHTGGNAIDLCPLQGNGSFWWTAPQVVWEKMGHIAESCGLDWCAGGYGNSWGWDNPHFELMKK